MKKKGSLPFLLLLIASSTFAHPPPQYFQPQEHEQDGSSSSSSSSSGGGGGGGDSSSQQGGGGQDQWQQPHQHQMNGNFMFGGGGPPPGGPFGGGAPHGGFGGPPPPGSPFGGPMDPNFFPSEPPPGFKEALSPHYYNLLLAVHQNTHLSPPQKASKIEQIMKSLPESELNKLPLPPPFRHLPQQLQAKVKAIFNSKTLSSEQQQEQVFDLINGNEVTPEQRKAILMPMIIPPPMGPMGPPPMGGEGGGWDDAQSQGSGGDWQQ